MNHGDTERQSGAHLPWHEATARQGEQAEAPCLGGKRKRMDRLGTVYLTGAGPGAADLLTVRAARILAGADIVVESGRLTDDDLAGDGDDRAGDDQDGVSSRNPSA